MASETILIVEDVPESLKFAAGALRKEGYKVSIASSAEQALSTLRFLQPDLILVDFMLPGMNGLELTSRIKQDPRLQKSIVVALTAYSAPEDEARAREVGCDGYLTKPIAAGALAARVHDFLNLGKDAPSAYRSSPANASSSSGGTGIPGLPENELEELQDSFLKAGKSLSRQLLMSLDSQVDAARATRTVHQWIGSAGLLGYPTISLRARDAETVLRSPDFTPTQLRGPFTNLARAFYNPLGAKSESAAQAAARALGGKRVALIGLSGEAADLMCGALEQAGARARLFDADQSPYSEAVGMCHLIAVHVRPGNSACGWLAPNAAGLPALPTIFMGSAEDLLALSPQAQTRASGLLMDGCLTEEVSMRLRLAISQAPPAAGRGLANSGLSDVVVAYGDATSHPLIEARMKEHGLTCSLASNGPDTILLVHSVQPHVGVVDASLDGIEALAAIRAEAKAMRTIIIASENQEDEILRAFSLGAEDYLVQPFSPLELVARVKRLM